MTAPHGLVEPIASTSTALVEDPLSDPASWQVVLRSKANNSDKVVLFNKERGSLSVAYVNSDEGIVWKGDQDEDEPVIEVVQEGEDDMEVISQQSGDHGRRGSQAGARSELSSSLNHCPLCQQPLPIRPAAPTPTDLRNRRLPALHSSYFNILSESRSTTPRATRISETPVQEERPFQPSAFNEGYFDAFFTKIERLGKGGNGVVNLVRHDLNGELIGLYACKQVAVGNSATRLPQLLREVRLLERLQHPNIIPFHHCWIENTRLISHGPPVPTLHILMAYANGGTLESFIFQRLGGVSPTEPESPADRRRRFRMRNTGSVHLLSLELLLSLFDDVTEGLEYLHDRNILHLDLKAGNVLLDWEEDALLPRAKLSDFGASDSTTEIWKRERSGRSGTLDWMPPEAFERDTNGRLRVPDRATDLWGLGLVLHLLVFFALPYQTTTDDDALEREIQAYQGFRSSDSISLDHGVHHSIPSSLLRILSRLLNRTPSRRPSCSEVLEMTRVVRSEGSEPDSGNKSALVPKRDASPLRMREMSMDESRVATDLAHKNDLEQLPAANNAKAIVARAAPPSLPLAQWLRCFVHILRAYSLQRHCRSGPPTTLGIWVILIPALIDLTSQQTALSFVVLLGHFVTLSLAKDGVVCEARFESTVA